jgi:hypothetical protein
MTKQIGREEEQAAVQSVTSMWLEEVMENSLFKASW